METVLQKMKWHTEVLQTELVRKAKLSETEEVFIEVFGEVSAHELLAAVVEGACAIRTCVIAQSRSLEESQYLLHTQIYMKHIPKDPPGATSCVRALS